MNDYPRWGGVSHSRHYSKAKQTALANGNSAAGFRGLSGSEKAESLDARARVV